MGESMGDGRKRRANYECDTAILKVNYACLLLCLVDEPGCLFDNARFHNLTFAIILLNITYL